MREAARRREEGREDKEGGRHVNTRKGERKERKDEERYKSSGQIKKRE